LFTWNFYFFNHNHIIKLFKFSRPGRGGGVGGSCRRDEIFQLSHVIFIIQFLSRKYKMWIQFYADTCTTRIPIFEFCNNIRDAQIGIIIKVKVKVTVVTVPHATTTCRHVIKAINHAWKATQLISMSQSVCLWNSALSLDPKLFIVGTVVSAYVFFLCDIISNSLCQCR
jgi:hypothetical protein